MATLMKTGLVVIVGLALCVTDVSAQGRGRGRGGQQGMRGRGAVGGPQARNQTLPRQMAQNRFRNGQAGARGPLRDGSGVGQGGNGQRLRGGQGQCNQLRQDNIGNQGRGRGQQVPSNLTQAEVDTLLLMREEEKLARDVYRTLAARWNDRVFENIARAETRHMQVVGLLIERNGLNDPVQDDTVGVFSSPKFSKLYKELVDIGNQSLNDAYGVGVRIEELDIKDLQDSLSEVSDTNIRRVYENLLRASQNHLRAFSSR